MPPGAVRGSALIVLLSSVALASTRAESADSRYLGDFEFIRRTVRQHSAALKSRAIDWNGHCERLRPRFASCTSDVDHVVNVRHLLSVLGDSHTGLWRTNVDRSRLPSKWDGLYGGGLWFAWDAGRVLLRGVMAGHDAEKRLPRGAALVEVDGDPIWLVLAREKRRITRLQGSSSDHSLFASLGNRLLPFGDRQELTVKFLTPRSKVVRAQIRRWGPGGKAFYPHSVQLPDGVTWQRGAVYARLKRPWCDKLGYLRVTGGMDEETGRAFHEAFDALEGMEAMVLDCRGMGGGSDLVAWDMAGRFFSKPKPNGRGRRIEPSGTWQYSGPVVMLQDELEVSSAETFTWAMSETERVVSVGRPTGGWGIIPRVYKCPSGLLEFRLGVTDRPTPIRGVHTEGVGWPPDVEVPYGPVFCGRDDPEREIGLQVLRLLYAGAPRRSVVEAFALLLDGHTGDFEKRVRALARKHEVDTRDLQSLSRIFAADLEATLALEQALLEMPEVVPDALGASRRLTKLVSIAREARLGTAARRLQKLADRSRGEARAQEALLSLLDSDDAVPARARAAFLRRYGKTRVGRFARERLWAEP